MMYCIWWSDCVIRHGWTCRKTVYSEKVVFHFSDFVAISGKCKLRHFRKQSLLIDSLITKEIFCSTQMVDFLHHLTMIQLTHYAWSSCFIRHWDFRMYITENYDTSDLNEQRTRLTNQQSNIYCSLWPMNSTQISYYGRVFLNSLDES